MFEGHHYLLLPLEYKHKQRVNYFKITSSLVTYCDSVTILKSFTASEFFLGEGGVSREKAFLVMPEIFHQILWKQDEQVVRTQDL